MRADQLESPAPLTLDAVLAERHAALRTVVDVDEPAVKLVIFTLGEEWFAFQGERIREILADASIYFVPGCPPSLEGVINVRGDIESVIRLNERLQLPLGPGEVSNTILLGTGGGIKSGIRVDHVVDVVDLPQSRIQPPPATLPAHLRPIVLGVLEFSARPVAVLDLDKLFADYADGHP